MKNILKKSTIAIALILGIFILFNFATTAIANAFPSFNFGFAEPVPQDGLADNVKIKSNGGLTPAELETMKEDDDTPYGDDIFRNFVVRETEKYVVIYRKGINANTFIYPNLSFVKTNNGLVWDGAWHFMADISTNWWNGSHDWNNAKYLMAMAEAGGAYSLNDTHWALKALAWIPLVGTGTAGVALAAGAADWFNSSENIVTFSDFNTNFAPNFWNMNGVAKLIVQNNERNTLFNNTNKFLSQEIMYRYFFEMADIQNIDNATIDEKVYDTVQMRMGTGTTTAEQQKKSISIFNSLATHLWQHSKTNDKTSQTKNVDISNYFNVYIAENKQSNYPISASKQAQYNGREFYSIYQSKVIANVSYSYDTTKVKRDDKKINDYIRDEKITVDPVVTTVPATSQLHLKLVNSNNSNLSQFNISNLPVTINLNGLKPVIFKTQGDLLNGKSIAVPTGTLVDYEIVSNGLVFNTYTGSIAVNSANASYDFDYTYQHNYSLVAINLHQITGTTGSNINLVNYPIRIILTGNNNEGTYQFMFDRNDKLNSTLTQFVKQGTYTFSVLSEQLIFSQTTGIIVVSPSERLFTFNYSVNTYQNDLRFDVVVTTNTISPGARNILLNGSITSVQTLATKLNGYAFYVQVKIFDEQGYILADLNHSHTSNVACSDSWNTSALTHGTQYTAQLLYISVANPDISYASGVVNFVYMHNTSFTFTYTATAV